MLKCALDILYVKKNGMLTFKKLLKMWSKFNFHVQICYME